jgi:peptidoglycan hydrolase CwlO-like protein
MQQRHKALEERERVLVQVAQELQQNQSFWEHHFAVLEMEVDGLENRIRNQREKLQQRNRELAAVGPGSEALASPVSSALVPAASAAVVIVPTPHAGPMDGVISEGLRRVAGLVADQRWHLMEQWERLLAVQSAWEQDRETVLNEVETCTKQLLQREQRVEERAEHLHLQEQILEARLKQLQQRQESLSQLRCSLEAWQARLKLQAAAWHSERDQVLGGVRVREQALAAQLVRAEQLYRKRSERLKEFAGQMRKARLRCDLVRKQYVKLWKVCQQQQQALLVEQQNVSRQTLALERFRQECVTQSSNPAAAEKRMDRLQRNCNTLNAEAMRQVERERESLAAEITRLDERSRQMAEMEANLIRRTDELAAQLGDLENQQIALKEADARREMESQQAQSAQRLAEQQAQELREEVERLARMLLDEADASGLVNQAA